jgi:hypothetical protein
MNQEAYDLAQSYKRCFTELTDGKAVYADLMKAYAKLTTFAVDPYVTAFNEGHRDVLLRITHLIEMASQPIEKVLEAEEDDTHG